MSGHIEPGELRAAYTVTTIDETPFAVAFTSDDLLDASLGVEGRRGDELAPTQNLYVSSGTPGTYTLTVQSFASGGDFRIGAAPLPSEASLEQSQVEGTIRGPGHLLVFDVDVPVGSVRFVTITTDRDLEVDATVTDVAGNAILARGRTHHGIGHHDGRRRPGPAPGHRHGGFRHGNRARVGRWGRADRTPTRFG